MLKYRVILQTGNRPKRKKKLLLPWNREEFEQLYSCILDQSRTFENYILSSLFSTETLFCLKFKKSKS